MSATCLPHSYERLVAQPTEVMRPDVWTPAVRRWDATSFSRATGPRTTARCTSMQTKVANARIPRPVFAPVSKSVRAKHPPTHVLASHQPASSHFPFLPVAHFVTVSSQLPSTGCCYRSICPGMGQQLGRDPVCRQGLGVLVTPTSLHERRVRHG